MIAPLVKIVKAVVYDKYTGNLAVPEGTIGVVMQQVGVDMFNVHFDNDSAALYNGNVKQWMFEGHELELVGYREWK